MGVSSFLDGGTQNHLILFLAAEAFLSRPPRGDIIGKMFFFIGGIGPRRIVLDDTRRPCSRCGRAACRHVRIDQYLSVFFIPLVRIKKGEPVWACEECGALDGDSGADPAREGGTLRPSICRTCGRRLEPDFAFCPKCGFRIDNN